MEYFKKAALSKKVRQNYMIKISLVGTVSLTGLVLAVISMFSGRFLFSFWYLVAFCLGLSYTVIRINTVFPTYLATDGEKLIFSIWDNGVFPYKIAEKAGIISDFIPERVKTEEIDFSELDRIYIGSKKYLKKTLTEEEYPEILRILEDDKHLEKTIKRMDFMVAVTNGKEVCLMSITDFDLAEVSEVIDVIERNCQGVKIHIHLPKLLRLRSKLN